MGGELKVIDDTLEEACGVFGCIATGKWPTNLDVAHIIYLGLVGLQHRGQESCGITTSLGDTCEVKTQKRDGLVVHSFKKDDLSELRGNLGIGHTRYSTLGGSHPLNIQPLVVHTKHGLLSLAHNGQLVNATKLRNELLEKGIGLGSKSDSELIVQILCMPPNDENNGPDWPARIRNLMEKVQMSYSMVIMSGEKIYAARDPFGNRPLCLGKVPSSMESRDAAMMHINIPENGTNGNELETSHDVLESCRNGNVSDVEDDVEGYVVSSESCAFSAFGGMFVREVQPGEIVEISKNGFKSVCTVPRPDNKPSAFCIFEYVYFAKAASRFDGQIVYTARHECGRYLARQAPVAADIVSAVPESAAAAAIGFALESNIPYTEVLCKNTSIGRTFIQPTQYLRRMAAQQKFMPLTDNFKGKRLVLVDDSIVRGTTIEAIIELLKWQGASEVHLRIASPRLHHPCYMGINIPTKEELIANKLSEEELAKKINADSLVHLTVENLLSAINKNAAGNETSIGHCTACLTGQCPIELEW